MTRATILIRQHDATVASVDADADDPETEEVAVMLAELFSYAQRADNHKAAKAKRKREAESLPKQRQGMLLEHLDDCSGQLDLFEDKEP